MTYNSCWLWQKAFIDPRDDATKGEQTYFRERYLSMREKAAALVSRIGADMKHMTVHDVTHLDALWEMASIVARDAIDLNPPEAFAFGGAVLLHDAAMSLAAYPNQLEGLKEHLVWKDSYARMIMALSEGTNENLDKAQVEALATAEALRKLHAIQAEKLPTLAWQDSTGTPEFLIDDPEVRNFYGPKIGQIAHSHWWPVGRIEEDLSNDLGPLGGRTNNRIDLVKLASLLRIADAMHLDRRRAPSFLKKLLNPEGISSQHWAFQERMAVPFVEDGALVYTAGSPFELDMAEAWWLAYDAVTLVDRELRDVDRLLQKRKSGSIRANRVKGVGTPEELSRYIETTGWVPVDSTIRVSDIPKIVETLGGRKLYGDNPTAAVRELLQNAADAVDARRRLQKRAPEWGTVTAKLEVRSDENWLIVEDSGVGMSGAVLTGPLIDFGNSFWRSPFAAEEFPGIQAAGVAPTGRYGIGFFSVFMLGSRVRVTSRRFDKAADSVRTLEFQNGLGSRPILYVPSPDLAPVDGGTRVEVRLDTKPEAAGGLLHTDSVHAKTKLFRHVVASIAPNLNVTLLVTQEGAEVAAVRPGDWLEMDEALLFARLSASEPSGKASAKPRVSRLRTLLGPDGDVFGRAAIETDSFGSGSCGCITIGGLRSTRIPFVRGVLTGKEVTASRNDAFPTVPPDILAEWASEQANLLVKAEMMGEQKARAAQVVLLCGGDIGELPVARLNFEWLSSDQLRAHLETADRIAVLFSGYVDYDENIDDVHPREFADWFEDDDKVLFVPSDLPGLGGRRERDMFLRLSSNHGGPRSLAEHFRRILFETWSPATDELEEEGVVGRVQGTEILRDLTIFQREEEMG